MKDISSIGSNEQVHRKTPVEIWEQMGVNRHAMGCFLNYS